MPSTSGPFVRCSAQPAQFAACRPAAGSQLQLRPPRKGRGAGEKGSGGLLHPAMHAGCGALASRVNGGCCRRCGQGGRHARGEGKLMSRFLLLLLPCAPPCHTPCCTLVNFYWCRRRLRPFCPPLGPGRRSGACCWRWLLSPLPVQPPQESSLCGFTHVAFSYCMLALAALALAILLNSALCRGFTFTITQQMY